MGYYTTDTVLDQSLTFLQDNCDGMTICSSQPASFSEAYYSSDNVVLARTSSVAVMSSSDFSIVNSTRASGGRALQTAAVSGITVVSSSKCTHVAMLSITSSALLHIVKCSSAGLTTGGTANLPSFKVEIPDPTSGTL